jgi:hypothetical protein
MTPGEDTALSKETMEKIREVLSDSAAFFQAAEEAGVEIDTPTAEKIWALVEQWDLEEALRGVRVIEHELNHDCKCRTCTEVEEIRALYGVIS